MPILPPRRPVMPGRPGQPRRTVAIALLVLVTLTSTPSTAVAATLNRAGSHTGTLVAWSWPVDGSHAIARPFIAPATPYASGHRGIDIVAPMGASVRAPADGIIHFSGFVVNRYVVSIDHGGGVLSSFEPVLSTLSDGDIVLRGQPIGALQSGHCGAPCLHLGVRVNGLYVSPLKFLEGIQRSVLLPTREIP